MMFRILATASALVFSVTASASGFDWGQDCDAGSGTFVQPVAMSAVRTVGVIPEGKRDIEILLNAPQDVDVQLIDIATGTELIAWPNGLLNGAAEECSNFQGLSFCYSGYNGGQTPETRGHEYIRINGATNREVEMRVYGYEAGDADVAYRFNPINTCNEIGDGSFSQYIPFRATTDVGTIPAGKTNVEVELSAAAGADVDVQLWDGDVAIVAWPNGLISGATEQTVEYKGMTIQYSGYNGLDGDWGHEKVTVTGTVSADLTMRAYGYQQGTANVDYAWGVGVGSTCGGIAWLQCADGLECKDWQAPHIADAAGMCHTPDWCGSDETAATDCEGQPTTSAAGDWTCSDTFTCEWNEIECETGPDATYVADSPEQCQVIRYTCEPGQTGFSNECGCGCECPTWLNCMPSPDGTNAACSDLDAFYAACPSSQVAF